MKTIRFKDEGQDFLEWDMDDTGTVVACRPFQADVWVGVHVLSRPVPKRTILISGPYTHGICELAHPVESVTEDGKAVAA